MPLTKKGAKIMRAMKETYGDDEKAKRVFYASANAGKISGVHRAKDAFPLTDEDGRLILFDNDTQLELEDGADPTRDGYLKANARVARVGTQIYHGYEVGMPDRSRVVLYRPPEEVFSRDSMRSHASKPVTLTHPRRMVDSRSWGKVAKGFSGNEVMRDGEFVRVPLMLTDAAAIEAFQSGAARELSVGYTTDLDWTPGVTPDGQPFDGVQREIRTNHHALVPVARGGEKLRFGDADDESQCPNCGAKLTGSPLSCPACGYDLKPTPRAGASISMDYDPNQPRDDQGKWTEADEAHYQELRGGIVEAEKRRPKQGELEIDPEEYDDNELNWTKAGAKMVQEGGKEWSARPQRAGAITARIPKGSPFRLIGAGDSAPYWLNDKEFSEGERKTLAKKGHALPGGGYPIRNRGDLGNAIQAFGRAKNPAATKALIKRRAKDLGAESMLPEDWQTDAADGGTSEEIRVMPIIRTFDNIPISFADEVSAAAMEREMRKLSDQLANLKGKKAKPFDKNANDEDMADANGGDSDSDGDDGDADEIERKRKKVTAEDGLRKAVATRDGEIAMLKKQLADAAMSDAKIEARAAERIATLDAAKPFLPKDFKDAGKTLADIRRIAVGQSLSDSEIKDWSDDEIFGAFKTLARTGGGSAKGGAHVMADGMSRGMRANAGSTGATMADAEAEANRAYGEYVQRLQDGYKQPFTVVRN